MWALPSAWDRSHSYPSSALECSCEVRKVAADGINRSRKNTLADVQHISTYAVNSFSSFSNHPFPAAAFDVNFVK